MSTRELRPTIMYARSSRRRKMVLDVDLNVVPPIENQDQVGTSAGIGTQVSGSVQQGGSMLPPPIDIDALDDDVIISSPRAFAEAKNNSRRTRGTAVVVDVDSGEPLSRVASNNRSKSRRVPASQTIRNSALYINLEGSSNCARENVERATVTLPPPPPPPKEPTFSCPVCMGQLVEEISTKCGHIFCKKCIKAAIAVQSKCPTCRRKITMKDTIRIYLPSTK